MMFMFLRPKLFRRLPSDSTSRWTPLPEDNGWQPTAPITDLHRQTDLPRSRHHKKNPANKAGFISQYSFFLRLFQFEA